jgi:bacterioferritin-associated ferredoxin
MARLGAQPGRERHVYVCNCNGIREREVRAAIAAGARRPVDVFRARNCGPHCAKCVCEMREIIAQEKAALRFAAE